MRPIKPCGRRGLTIIEVLAVLVVLIVLTGILVVPVFSHAPDKKKRIICVNNLKTIGLVFRTLAPDDGLYLSMDRSAALVGDTSRLWKPYLSLSRDLATPKSFWCPADTRRQPAQFWETNTTNTQGVVFSNNQNVSYFLGLNGTDYPAEAILAGDRNLTTNGVPIGSGLHLLDAGTRLGFTGQIHGQSGNVLLGDGSVQQVTSRRLDEVFHSALGHSRIATNAWLLP